MSEPVRDDGDIERFDSVVDELGDGLGPAIALPETWCPGDDCPRTGEECAEHTRCFENSECALRATTTSKLAAEAGAILARWAEEAGAEGMCRGCAFRLGTRANRTSDTIIQIAEAAAHGVPFFCHDGDGGSSLDTCRGWEALNSKAPLPSDPERA